MTTTTNRFHHDAFSVEADFAVAAHQLAGKQIPYDNIKDLNHTKIIVKGDYSHNGNYMTTGNKPIIFGQEGVQTGDFVYWGKVHVGILYQDKSDPIGDQNGKPDGIFNQWDTVIHTLFAEPQVVPVGEAFGKSYLLTIYRFTH
ncbi:MAG: hypothetical protein K9M99_12625 [Candidatus Cloacimonetes bacterium]|nr:hypothetical protein [Candidatus Cloacimonadota bacterium]